MQLCKSARQTVIGIGLHLNAAFFDHLTQSCGKTWKLKKRNLIASDR